MAINLQDLRHLSDRLPKVASLFQESRVKWLTDRELESLFQASIDHPSLLPISEVKPPLKKEGIYFFLGPYYQDKNYHDLPDYHTTVATKTNENGSVFARRNQRCKNHGDIAIIHYLLEKVNGKVEALKEKTKHAKSKFKATDSDGGSRTIGSYSSSSEDSAPQQKEDVEVKKTLRELLEPARMRQLEVQRRRTLHLSNMSYDVTEDDIGIGGSMDVRIPLGQDGKCRGFAFVEFDYPRSAEEGLKLHLKPMLKRSVHISIAHPRVAGVGRGRGAR